MVARTQPRSTRARAKLAVVLAIFYLVTVAGFWIAGALAYVDGFHGPVRLLGLLYVPILALPVTGHGALAGLAVRSPIWLWWFGLQVVLAVATIGVFPFDRWRRRVIGASVERLRARSVVSARL
jgi:hypothetical protein